MTGIVVSRRDGILRAPDGTKHRVARGKTLADADHPAVLANPGDWVPMVVTLTSGTERSAAALPRGGEPAGDDELREQVAELEETLAARDAEMLRLADNLAARGVDLPAEEDREPGWLVDLVFAWMDRPLGRPDEPDVAVAWPSPDGPNVTSPEPPAPPRGRKRTSPPLVTRTGDDD
jgi:hypothetical protein